MRVALVQVSALCASLGKACEKQLSFLFTQQDIVEWHCRANSKESLLQTTNASQGEGSAEHLELAVVEGNAIQAGDVLRSHKRRQHTHMRC
jgi:hypothetical protein